jgi:hypothetical protein
MKAFSREEWGKKRAALPVDSDAVRARGEGKSARVCLELRNPLGKLERLREPAPVIGLRRAPQAISGFIQDG